MTKEKRIKIDKEEKMSRKEAENLHTESDGTLIVDVYKDGDGVIVQSVVAGVDPDELEINITHEAVTIRGERKRNKEIEEKDFYYQECFWGSFSRTIFLPDEIDPDKSDASFKDGVLTVTMPLLKKKKAKKIKVKTD